jgi:hypothetical protein
VRTFRTFSGDLHRLAERLSAVGITTIAMESTGVYWIPVFEILEARGFEVLLVNARDVNWPQDRCQRCSVAATASPAWVGARQLPSPR